MNLGRGWHKHSDHSTYHYTQNERESPHHSLQDFPHLISHLDLVCCYDPTTTGKQVSLISLQCHTSTTGSLCLLISVSGMFFPELSELPTPSGICSSIRPSLTALVNKNCGLPHVSLYDLPCHLLLHLCDAGLSPWDYKTPEGRFLSFSGPLLSTQYLEQSVTHTICGMNQPGIQHLTVKSLCRVAWESVMAKSRGCLSAYTVCSVPRQYSCSQLSTWHNRELLEGKDCVSSLLHSFYFQLYQDIIDKIIIFKYIVWWVDVPPNTGPTTGELLIQYLLSLLKGKKKDPRNSLQVPATSFISFPVLPWGPAVY